LTFTDLEKLNLVAIEGSFLPDGEKRSLRSDYQAAVKAFRTRHGV